MNLKRFWLFLVLLIVVLICRIANVDIKKEVLKKKNYLKIFNTYIGRENLQEINGIYFEKEKFGNGYLVKNQMGNVCMSSGVVIYRGLMDGKKTILVMNENATYKYQNIADYKCYIYEQVSYGDVIATNDGTPYYEVRYEN